jgi:FtsZ-binding cell division protein ZapB
MLIVNRQSFEINYSLLCCVSDKFLQMNCHENEFSFDIPNEHLNCLISLMKILRGSPFVYQKFDLSSVMFFINFLHLTCLFTFISKSLPIPSTIQESITFVIMPNSESFNQHFNQSVSVLSSNFDQLTFDQIKSLSNSCLEQIFSSDSFQIESEDHLFNLIFQLIEDNPLRKSLLKSIKFPFVSTELLQFKLIDFPLNENDIEIFESLKPRLYCDVLIDQSSISQNRWTNQPKIKSKQKIDDLHQQRQNLQIEIKEMKKENIEVKTEIVQVKKENQEIQNENQKLKEEIENLKNPFRNEIQINFNGKLAIIDHLRKIDPNSVLISYQNGGCCGYESPILFEENDRCCCINPDTGSITFQFKTKKIVLLNYLLRFYSHYFPQGWKLEGSIDNSNWTLLDSKKDQNCFDSNYKEMIFPCQSEKAFSYFKITPTQKSRDYPNQTHWRLTFVEFSGIILDT